MASATEALKQQTGLIKKPTTFADMLETMRPQIQMALPRHLSPDRMIRIALTCLRINPKLAECTPESLIASIMIASQLGLEPGIMGQAHLVPYKNKQSGKSICTLIPGWQGLLDLVNRAGKATAWTGAVYAGDYFEWALGDKPFAMHKPSGDEATLTHVYAIARTKGSDFPIIEVWPMEKILKHRDRYNKVGTQHYSYEHFEMYARKVALLQALKYVPRSIELATAFQLEASAETGQQNYELKDVKNVIDGIVEPEAEVVEPERVTVDTRKPVDTICGSCGGKNEAHEATCKHYKAVATAPEKGPEAQPAPEPTQTIKTLPVKILAFKARKTKPLLMVKVLTNEGEKILSVWHENTLIPILNKHKPGVLGVFEIQETLKGGEKYLALEHIHELDGVQFVDDKPVASPSAAQAGFQTEDENW